MSMKNSNDAIGNRTRDVSYNCVYQHHRLEQVCRYRSLEPVIHIRILRDWCWFVVMVGGVRPLAEWRPSSPPLAAQTETPPRTHITFYPNILNLLSPIPWLPFYALMTFTTTALPFISHSYIINMYTSREHQFGREFIIILTTRLSIHSETLAGCINTW